MIRFVFFYAVVGLIVSGCLINLTATADGPSPFGGGDDSANIFGSSSDANDPFGKTDAVANDPFGSQPSNPAPAKKKVIPTKTSETDALRSTDKVLFAEMKTMRALMEAQKASLRDEQNRGYEMRIRELCEGQRERERLLEKKLFRRIREEVAPSEAKLQRMFFELKRLEKSILRAKGLMPDGKTATSPASLRVMTGMSEMERSCRESLDDITNIEFLDSPISEVFELVEGLHSVQIVMDLTAIKKAGLDVDNLVVNEYIANTSLRSALHHILQQMDPSLTYAIKDGMILMTTVESGKDREMAVYDAKALLAPEETAEDLMARFNVLLRLDKPSESPIERLTLTAFQGKLIATGPEWSQHKFEKLLQAMLAEKRE